MDVRANALFRLAGNGGYFGRVSLVEWDGRNAIRSGAGCQGRDTLGARARNSVEHRSERIAAYGESAGGHLAATTAITGENPSKEDLNGVPNALVLYSPALNAQKNERFQKLVKSGQDVVSILPEEHIRRGMPPTIILTGELDTLIPPVALIEFCDKMKRAHNRCELQIYPGVGHMLQAPGETGKGGETTARARYDALLKLDQFLASLGYLPAPKKKN